MLVDAQPEAVGGRRRRRPVPGKARCDGPAGEHLRQLHLPPAGAPQRMRIAGLGVARRERGGETGDPAGEVAHAAEDAAHRGERAGRVEGQLGPAAGRAPVTARHAREPRGLLAGNLELLRVVAGARHAQGPQQAVADVVRVCDAGDGGDDPAQDRVPEVGVLEPGARRPVEAHALGQEGRELLKRQALLPVTPRVVGREARGHGQQVPDRYPRRVRAHRRPAAQFGNVVLG